MFTVYDDYYMYIVYFAVVASQRKKKITDYMRKLGVP